MRAINDKYRENLHHTFLATLLVILSIGVFLFYLSSVNPAQQYTIVILFSLFYFLWGMIYHTLKGDFHLKIVVEYLLIALLAVLLARGAIFH